MLALGIIEQLGLDKAISINSEHHIVSESQSIVLNEAKNFGIDHVYFCTDENKNSYPAVFIKGVSSFNSKTLEKIADIHKQIWNYKKVVFLYVFSKTEIRIYNCAERPLILKKENFDYEKELERLQIKSYKSSDTENLKELNTLFSSIAIDTGIIWTIEEAESIRKRISLQRRVDKYLVESLVKTTKELKSQGLDINFINKIIMRSLFLLYLEDRGATDEIFYSKIKKGAKSYFDILEDKKTTYDLFKKLEEHFNGNVFTVEDGEAITTQQLQLIKKCFINGNDNTPQTNLFDNWRLFDFSIIQIELLSEIYENFLLAISPELKHQTGTFYTPPALVDLILNEKLPINHNENNYNVKILDPSCGSGIFLVESFKRLVKRYENKHKEKLTDFNKLKQLLTNNIFGIEIHSQSIKVAAFSLYLALVDNLNPKTIWQNKNNRLPYLINDPNDKSIKEQGRNLYRRDTIETNKEIESIEFDLVVGNPPFGTEKLLSSIRNYCNNFNFAKEMVLPFLHKATFFSKNGEIALIFNTKVLTNTGGTYQVFRNWLFNECYVEKIYNFSILRKAPENFGGQLFGSATGPISIVFYRKKKPLISSDKIIYYAPKTYIKSNIIEGVNIDSTDIKYLPREECQKKDTKIWKIAMWGGMGDLLLLNELSSKYPSLKKFFKNSEVEYGVGFELSNPASINNTEIRKLPIHTPNNILKYSTPVSSYRINNEKFRRLGKREAYKHPHILLNEGVKVDNSNLSILASFVDYESAFSKGIVGIYSKNDNVNLLKLLTIYFNTDFIKYYSFLTTSSWGIERDVVKHKELFNAPYLLSNISEKKKSEIIEIFNKITSNQNLLNDTNQLEKKINSMIFEELSEKNRIVINHLLDNIDLFYRKEKSKTLLPVSLSEIKKYGELICHELCYFLEGQYIFANATIYNIHRFSPLMMIKISFDTTQKEILESKDFVYDELIKIDNHLWEKETINIFFRKKLNYKIGDNIYLIRPNQRRFWSQSMALEDSSELILEILNEN